MLLSPLVLEYVVQNHKVSVIWKLKIWYILLIYMLQISVIMYHTETFIDSNLVRWILYIVINSLKQTSYKQNM